MTDHAILRDLARRIKRTRLEKNITQQRLADITGLNRTTIRDMEQGKPFGVLTLIQLLRGLEKLEEFQDFLPEPGVSPLKQLKMQGKERQRASRKHAAREKGVSEW